MNQPTNIPACWFCERPGVQTCRCRRVYCSRHGVGPHCMLCALAYGIYEEQGTPNFVGDLLTLSLTAASGDPYLVIPSYLQGAAKLPISGIERTVMALIQVAGVGQKVQTGQLATSARAAATLARMTVTWPSMDPSQVSRQQYGTSLISVTQVRGALLQLLKDNRSVRGEPVALPILDNLRLADFREIYPDITTKLETLRIARVSTSVQEIIQTLGEVYPTRSYSINERCELLIYEQYTNRKRGAGDMLERMYGPMLRHAPPLAHILKKGVYQSNYPQFQDWYPGEDEPR